MKSRVITINNREIPCFIGFNEIKNSYFTKTTLRNEYNLRPLDVNAPDAIVKIMIKGQWKDYYLFNKEQCVEIKKRPLKQLDATDRNLAKSLYLINKSAKFSRDTKMENYKEKKFDIVSAAKTREYKLYELKKAILQKLKAENKIEILGYHCIYGKPYSLMRFNEYTFHEPIQTTEGLVYLGEFSNKVSAEKSKDVGIDYFEAKHLLERYVGAVESN